MPIDPNTGQEQSAQSLLDLMQPGAGQADPYGGKTIAQILQGGAPLQDMSANQIGYGNYVADWANQAANNENVSAAIGRGGQYQPEVAKTLQSSGAEGGFFSIPGTQSETNVPWGYYPDARENPAPGLAGMSTNNWRLMPRGYQDPRWAMRAGHIIDRSMAANPGAYVAQHGSPSANATPSALISPATNLGPGGHGYPLSWGYPFGPRGSFFPGQIEPWQPEGGGHAMGAGVT